MRATYRLARRGETRHNSCGLLARRGPFRMSNARKRPPKLIQFFSRDRRRDVFYTSLCACRCLRASDRGRAPGHDPSDGRARSVRADRASSHRSSGSVHSMGRPRPSQHTADVSSSLDASNNDPPPDTSSRRSTRSRHLPDWGTAGERRSLAAGEVRRSEFRLRPG